MPQDHCLTAPTFSIGELALSKMKLVISILYTIFFAIFASEVMASVRDDEQETRYLNSVAHRFRFSPGLIYQFANVPARQRRANNLANMMRLGKRAIDSAYEESQPVLETYADSHPSTL